MRKSKFYPQSILLRVFCIVLFLTTSLFSISPLLNAASAAEVTVAWDANSEENLAGYKLYYKLDDSGVPYNGTGLYEGDSPVTIYLEDLDDLSQPQFPLSGLDEGQAYFIALTAFDESGIESDYSDEVSFEVPSTSTSYTITASATGQGTISPEGSVSVSEGDAQEFMITASEHCHIAGVTVDGSSVGQVASYTFENVSTTHAISAVFEIDTYTVTASAGDNGTISPAGVQSVAYGGSLGFAITPDNGYRVSNVLVDGSSVGDVSAFSFENISTWHTIEAVFEVDPDANDDTSTSDDTDNTSTDDGSTKIIIDNGDTGTYSTGTWKESSGSSYYESVSIYSNQVGADYTFEADVNGAYELSIWWTELSNRSTEVPVEIWDGDALIDTVFVNQQENGGQWNVQGVYNFSGSARIVVISESTAATTCADAVKLSYVPGPVSPAEVIIDNGDTGTYSTGTWKESSGSSYYESVSIYSKQVGADYTFEADVNGAYELSLWWTELSNRSTEVPVEIWDGETLLDTVFVNQKENGGQWNVQGVYNFSGSARIVVASESTKTTTCADAVKLSYVPGPVSPAEVIIDNGDTGTYLTGTWKESSGSSYYESVSIYSNQVGADYTFEADVNGAYELSIWWTELSNRSTEVPVEIWDGDALIDTVFVNQQENGGQWNVQGVYNFSGSARIVVISESTAATTCADAVKLSYVPGPVSPAEVIIDNGDTGTYSTGTWKESSGSSYYESVSIYSNQVGADYTFEADVNGAYELSIWWTELSNRSTEVPVEIWDGDALIDTVFVNQQENGGQWNVQGVYNFSGSARIVVISESAAATTCADAVKLSIEGL